MSSPSIERKRELAELAELPQLFGRGRELALINDLFEHVDARGRSLLIRGEAGIGKSALLGEAKKRAGELGMHVLNTSGAPFETQMPFAGLHPSCAHYFVRSGHSRSASVRLSRLHLGSATDQHQTYS
jgi:hypothetical protein